MKMQLVPSSERGQRKASRWLHFLVGLYAHSADYWLQSVPDSMTLDTIRTAQKGRGSYIRTAHALVQQQRYLPGFWSHVTTVISMIFPGANISTGRQRNARDRWNCEM